MPCCCGIAGIATRGTGILNASAVSRISQATGSADGGRGMGRSWGKVASAVSGVMCLQAPLL